MLYFIKAVAIILTLAIAILAQSPTEKPVSAAKDEKPASVTKEEKGSVQQTPIINGERTDYLHVPTDAIPYASKKSPIAVAKFTAAPTIDGILNEEVWKTAPVFGDFLQVQPGDNVAPTHPTEFMMAYDAKNLYLAFRVKQTRDSIRATVARRDNIFNDDYVLLYLDTFNDQQQAYIVSFNPLGIQADGTFTESRGEDYSVDIVMDSKGVLTEDGYTIEAAIPFKSLRYEAGKNKQWGVHVFRRVKYMNGELNSWMPNNRSLNGSLIQAGHVTGLDGIETTRQLEVIPSFTLSESGRRTQFTFNNDPSGRYVNDGLKGEFGLTAKFGLTPTITLDFAYNPDFAQVEADAPISTANLRFPVFFPEKRPFFLERIDIFQSGLNVVNTRSIVDPDLAAKLTGRRGKNTFGVMYASDNGTAGNLSKDDRLSLRRCIAERANPLDLCPNERIFEENAEIGVARYKRDFGRENNIGFFGTTYNFVDHHNHTAGLDGRYKLNPRLVGEFQLLGTHTRGFFYEPELDRSIYRTGNGVGYRGYLERSGRNLYMNFLAQGRSPDYRADVGFTNRVDTNYYGSYIQYETDRDAKKSIVSKRIWNETNISFDWKGRSQYFITNTRGQLALQKQTFVGGNIQYGFERVYENEFGPIRTPTQGGAFAGPSSERGANFTAVQAFFESTPSKQWYFFAFMDFTWGLMEYDFGAGPDFPRVSQAYLDYLAQCSVNPVSCTGGPGNPPVIRVPGLDPGPGDQLTIESQVRYQPTTAFQTQLNYTKRRLERHDTGLLAFDDNLFSSRSTYQFTRDIFARLRVDYSTLNKRVRSQLVFGWTPNPGTAFYVGYNDDMNYNGYNPYTNVYEPGLHGNGRTFFIKMSYLFKRSF